MTINTHAIQLFLSVQQDNHASIRNGLAIQILPSVQYLPRCFKHQFAAFIRNQGCLVVWDDEPEHLVSRAAELESLILATIWNGDEMEEMEEKRENVPVNVVRVEDSEKENDLEAMAPEPRSIVLWNCWDVDADVFGARVGDSVTSPGDCGRWNISPLGSTCFVAYLFFHGTSELFYVVLH